MIKLDITVWTKQLDDLQKKQIPFATARALTTLAKQVAKVQQKTTNQVVDRPNPYTKIAMYSTSASKAGPYTVDVGYKRQQAAYLAPQLGGERRQKPFERVINGVSKFVVPGSELSKQGIDGIKLDSYGNISKDQVEFLVAIANSGDTTSDGKTKRYFRGKPKGGAFGDGVFARVQGNQKIVPLLLFVDQGSYKTTINFNDAEKAAEQLWPSAFEAALKNALDTAK